ncbi:maleylpyruvate isomerase N-terminal domain-containing protein [Streptomyces sp. NPDC047841]|uniref:maleylpyruvate isomerase N-terminal domain-containing protein n=1 Tax=Streptomyces sp. NPDC047841 TaxID=3154708 RepID=UPI003454741D
MRSCSRRPWAYQKPGFRAYGEANYCGRGRTCGVPAAELSCLSTSAEHRSMWMTTQDSPRELSEQHGFSDGVEIVHRIFKRRRHAFFELLQDISTSSWGMPSRCSDWSIHQVVRHVRDAAKIHVARLRGSAFPFTDSAGTFDPKTSPSAWLTRSEGETPHDTLLQLREILDEENRLLEGRLSPKVADLVPGPLRRKLHWSVNSVHTLWDAWMHERDICLPLGLKVEMKDDETRLMAMYTLLVAAAPPAWEGDYIHVTLGLNGSPDGAYSVRHEGDNICVRAAAGTPDISGPMETVLDSLAGRGPELSEVLGASGPAVRKLAILRAVAT